MGVLVTHAVDAALQICVRGILPNSCFAHMFGDGKNADGLFDPTQFADVKLKATQGGAGGAGAVVIQQLRR